MKNSIDVTDRFYSRPIAVDESFASHLHKKHGENLTFEVPEENAASWLSVHSSKRASEDGLAYIYISGTLLHGYSYGISTWFTGYDYIAKSIMAAQENKTVKGIVFLVDSHGGEVSGCFECADLIANSKKPTLAVVGSYAHSAAYALASKADKITMPRTGSVGSIGVLTMHVDYSERLKEQGVKPTIIFSGKHKVDGNPYEPLKKEVKAKIQKRLDELRSVFVESVAQGRGIDSQVVYDTEAQTFGAEDALSLGLADAVQSPAEAIAAFKKELFGSNNTQEGENMSKEDKGAEKEKATQLTDADVSKAAADATKNERARIQSILTDAEADGRAQMANHLAFSTDMSADDAVSLLKSAPKESGSKEKGSKSDFEEAMEQSGNPEIQDDDSDDSTAGEDSLDAAFNTFDKVHGNSAKQ